MNDAGCYEVEAPVRSVAHRDRPRDAQLSEIVHAKLRGVIGAMAMTGVRVFAVHAGLIREDPPSRLVRKQKKGRQRRWVVELVHWAMGGVFGIGFGLIERDWPKGRERAVFVADHLLFGFVLSEMRSRPRE
jgi:hypothetical protein